LRRDTAAVSWRFNVALHATHTRAQARFFIQTKNSGSSLRALRGEGSE
jgi:hypothetical protein